MKKTILLFLFLLGGVVFISAQEIKPFKIKIGKGIQLDKKNLPLLTDKTWTVYKQYQVRQNEASAFAGGFQAFKFKQDGKLEGAANKLSVNGNWKITNKRQLLLTTNETQDASATLKVEGAYRIFKLNENELVLIKSLQKDSLSHLIYYCKGSKSVVLAESPIAVSQSVTTDKKALDTARQKREQEVLVGEIETEAQLRRIKLKEKLNEMDVKALQALKKQLLAGTYRSLKNDN